MTLQINIPSDRLDDKRVVAALQDLGAEHISAGEWRYHKPATPDEFHTMLKLRLGSLAVGITVTTFNATH